MNDNVNHPQHYTNGPECPSCGAIYECISFTETMNFCIGNAMKYLWRAGKKDCTRYTEDLEKAIWYINKEISRTRRNGVDESL